MTAATAFCTSNTIFYQHALVTTRPKLTTVLARPTVITLSSPSSSPTFPTSHDDQPFLTDKIKSDENNNHHQRIEGTTIANLDDVLYITSDDDDDIDEDDDQTEDIIGQARFLSLVGLRTKNTKSTVPMQTVRPLTKRLACPVCLLPLPKHSERVRQALYIRLPFLKFLKITRDIEKFCSTDDKAKAQSLLPRCLPKTRALRALNKHKRKQKLSKTALIKLAGDTFSGDTSQSSMDEYLHSILQCHVALDRLEQSTIDQLMQDSIEMDGEGIELTSTEKQSSPETPPRTCYTPVTATQEMMTTTTTTCTTITTMTTEKMIVKRKSTSTGVIESKRFKSANHDSSFTSENDTSIDASLSMYKRIYLKCFVCSKRDYVNVQTTHSDVLHSHWLEHGGDLSLNIYDSEIDSILTRVVEFFNSPRRHTLEGRIKTIFILNSKEIRRTPINNSVSSDSCIVID